MLKMASPAGMTTKAGPGNTSSATPIRQTVVPTMPTIMRLAVFTLVAAKPLGAVTVFLFTLFNQPLRKIEQFTNV